MPNPTLIACPTCDLLQYEVNLPEGRFAGCGRCGTALYRRTRGSIDRTLALALAAVVLMAIANTLPIASIEVRGIATQTTLYGAIEALWNQERGPVAGLVFATTIAAPVIELGAMLYMLLPLRLGYEPKHLALAFRLAPIAREWGLIDVFMLGVVVSLIKLGNLADVVLGPALWSFGALILLLTMVGANFNAREIWAESTAYRKLRRGRARRRAALARSVS
jgi:paraquat-inducible protein A